MPDQQAKRRGRPPSLTVERIVAAALVLADRSRLEDVSMRALASELGVPVMTVYNYVPSKESLHELVVDHVLRSVEVPPPDAGSWDERIRRLERNARKAMQAHPGLSLSRHSGGGAEAARLAEGVITILRSGGFGADEAAIAFATLYTYMLGQIEMDVLAHATGGHGEATFEGTTSTTRLSRDDLFEVGLDAVIAGITAKLIKPRARHSRAKGRRRHDT